MDGCTAECSVVFVHYLAKYYGGDLLDLKIDATWHQIQLRDKQKIKTSKKFIAGCCIVCFHVTQNVDEKCHWRRKKISHYVKLFSSSADGIR